MRQGLRFVVRLLQEGGDYLHAVLGFYGCAPAWMGFSSRMVKKLEPGLTGEVTIQPSRAPRLDFNCALPHIHRQCARKQWRGTDAWIGRPYWHISRGQSIKNCCCAMSTWSRKIVSSATRSRGASG